jgi:hypothetical protein
MVSRWEVFQERWRNRVGAGAEFLQGVRQWEMRDVPMDFDQGKGKKDCRDAVTTIAG